MHEQVHAMSAQIWLDLIIYWHIEDNHRAVAGHEAIEAVASLIILPQKHIPSQLQQ